MGGVEIGSINPQLAPRVAPIAGATGLTPAAKHKAIITGITILAAAVLDVASLIIMEIKIDTRVILQTEFAPLKANNPWPMASASYV